MHIYKHSLPMAPCVFHYQHLQKLKRQEEMGRKQQEIQKESERKKKEAAEKKFQDRKAARQKDPAGSASNGEDPLNSTGIFIPERDVERKVDSPPIPSMRGKQNGDGNGGSSLESNQDDIITISDGGPGLTTSDDDQETAQAKQQLSNMRQQLNKKEEELSSEARDDPANRRQSQVWEGLAEV